MRARGVLLRLVALLLASPMSLFGVIAVLQDSEGVSANTISTASVFEGTRIVQSGTLTSSGLGLVSAVLPESVDPSRAFLLFTTRHSGVDAPDAMVRGRLASSTTVEFGRVTGGTGDVEISWTVVEYFSGVSVQRGEVLQTSTSIDVTLGTAVSATDQAFVTTSKTPASADTGWDEDDPILAELTSTTNLQIRSGAANAGHRIWWQVIEFTNPAHILVQRGTTSLLAGDASDVIALPTGVDTSKSFVLIGHTTSGSGSDIGARVLRGRLVDANNLLVDRALSGDADDIDEVAWQVVELNDGSSVTSASVVLSGGQATDTINIGAVDTTRAAAFVSGQASAGQSLGRSNYSGGAVLGEASVTLEISGNLLNIERESSNGDLELEYYIVEFADL